MKIFDFAQRYWRYLAIYFFLIPFLSYLTYIRTVPVSWLAILVPSLSILGQYEPIRERWDNYRKRREIEQRTKKFNKVLLEFERLFKEDFLKLEDVGGRENLIEYSKGVFPPDKNMYLKIFFFYLKEKDDFELNNYEKTSLSNEIISLTRNFSLQNPSGEDLKLALAIYQLFCKEGISEPVDLDKADDHEFFNDECFKDKFVRRYVSKEEIISKLTSERQDVEEYRLTLSRLLESGRLDKYGIQKVISGVDEEFERVITDRTHYFILINEIQRGSNFRQVIIDNLRKNGHQAYGGLMNVGGGMFSLILAVTKKNMETREFYEEYIQEAYQAVNKDGWVSIHKAEFKGEAILKKRYVSKDPSDDAMRGLSSRSILTTGEEVIKISLKEKLIETYLSTDELLTVLPLNLFLPDLSSEKKNILIENNEEIKKKLGITRLTDWANPSHNTEEIANFLRDNYFPSDSVDTWVENVNKIINEAGDVEEALR